MEKTDETHILPSPGGTLLKSKSESVARAPASSISTSSSHKNSLHPRMDNCTKDTKTAATLSRNESSKRALSSDPATNDEHDRKKRKVDDLLTMHARDTPLNGDAKRKKKKKRRKQSVTTGPSSSSSTLVTTDHIGGNCVEVGPAGPDAEMNESGGEVSVKGKGKATDEPIIGTASNSRVPRIQMASRVSESEETTMLRDRISQDMDTIKRHSKFLSDLVLTLTCQICYDPLLKPYTLAPCGHTSCYLCLVRWFRAPPSHMQPPPVRLRAHFDPNDETMLRLDSPMLLHKKKTCPQCRGIVREAPIEARELKSIAAALRSSGLSSEMNMSEGEESRVENAPTDPWKGIFNANELLQWAGNFRGGHMTEGAAPRLDRGVYDPEDSVYRCRDCHHEIADGICTSCHRVYPGHLTHIRDFVPEDDLWADFTDEGDWDDEDDEMDADELLWGWDERSIEETPEFAEGLNLLFGYDYGGRGPRRNNEGSQRSLSDSNSDSQSEVGSPHSDDGSYEGSFIDDGDEEEDGEVDEMVRWGSRSRSFRLTEDDESIESDGGGSTDEHPDEDIHQYHHRRPRRWQGRPIYISDDDEEIDDEAGETVASQRMPLGDIPQGSDDDVHFQGFGDVVDSRNDAEESDDFVPRRPRVRRGRRM